LSAGSILLVGATGVFGDRLARQLAAMPGVALTVTSRDAARAESLAAKLRDDGAVAEVKALPLDNRADLPKLASLAPWLVIDASGPFQGGDYSIARASLEAGAHYLDLADARDHVLGFAGALDPLARERNLVALTGASTTPALSSAVVEALTVGWRRVDSIEAAITPGGASEVGQSVIEAILSYAGRPIPVWRAGRLESVPGWGTAERWEIPGLGHRWVSPVETPDAELLSSRFEVCDRVRFLAGLESKAEHFGMLALARILGGHWRTKGLARMLHGARRFTRPFCGDRGGMAVRVCGVDEDGATAKVQWSLLAKNDDGPYTPTLAAVASVRALLDDRVEPGARPCVGVLKLAEIEKEMSNFAITTRRENLPGPDRAMFRDALGEIDYDALPASLRAFHDRAGEPVWTGVAEVDVGGSLLARAMGAVFGLQEPGRSVPLRVAVERGGGAETWTRIFGSRRFRTRLTLKGHRLVEESVGPFAFDLALGTGSGSVSMPVSGWRFFGLPMPCLLAPVSEALEYEDAEGRYCFDVKLSMPFGGLLAHYRGWLRPGAAVAQGRSPSQAQELVAAIPARAGLLVTGATGFIGRRLCEALSSAGHDVIVLVRNPAKASMMSSSFKIVSSLNQIANDTKIDAIVNLAGEPIGTQLWTSANRRHFVASRVKMTRDVIALMERLAVRPSVLVNGSAIGWYGLHMDEKLTEKSAANPCFSHDLCEAWEVAAKKAEALGVRVVLLRIGLVLGTEGGPLRQMLSPFRLGLGGRFGDGSQWMSWIARDDLVRLIAFAIADKRIEGAFNATAPAPVRNLDFARSLARAVRRPMLLPMPASVLRAVGGDFAKELLLGGQRVLPDKAVAAGFTFQCQTLDEALVNCLGRRRK